MNKRYYISYGSNLSVEQMAHRCPDAKIVGMAAIKDWKLVFRVHANIEPCEGRVVPVLIWEISGRDERNLDLYEGYPSYYYKQDMAVTMTDLDGRNPQEITAMVYLMNDGHPIRTPMKGYYDTLEEGYTRFGFNTHLLELAFEEAMEVEHGLC